MRGSGMRALLVHEFRSANNNHQDETNVSTPTSTPTPTARKSQPRVALASKDKNALIQTPQKPTKRGIIMPPSEKQQQHHTRTLLSSATKPLNRPPLTPRIAGTTPRTQPNGTPFAAQKDEYAPPVSGLLNSNITPRSGSRRSRIESPKSSRTTPTGTPTPSAPVPKLADPPRRLGTSGARHEDAKRSSVTFAPASEFTSKKPQNQQNTDSKFFFASDAKSSPQPSSQRPGSQAKGSTFFYANGDSIPPAIKSSSSAAGSTTGEERLAPMFFHANGASDITPSLHSPNSNISTSHLASPRLAHSLVNSPQQRPPLSPRSSSHSSVVSTRSTPARHTPIHPRPNILAARGQRSQNITTPRSVSSKSQAHSRSTSVGSFELTPPGRKNSRSPVEILPVTPTNFSGFVALSTPEGRPDEKDEHRETGQHALGSPVRAGGTLEHMNELAAEARRNRKVLDLEITNSSLEAINRTLERQMRKQNAELRRYRRLSRSGRLSLANPISTGEYSIMAGMDGADLSDMSEEEDDEDQEDNISEEDSMDDGSLSPEAMAESDARHRHKDEERLRLDLSKHQQLIADSQAMNSSLKRCLAWTDELISEGKRALDYKVRSSDVTLGGRILVSEDMEIDETEGLSEIGARLVREARQKRQSSLSPSASTFGGSNDRDSGIELPSNYRPDACAPYINTHMEHPPV